jgi:hypothetical protein
MNNGLVKIKMINASFRCYTFGLLALLPFIGIPFGIIALVYAGKARAGQKLFWNPAQSHRACGLSCAFFATIFWVIILLLMIYSS